MARIMLCDDSKTILNLFEKKLKDAGHEIAGRASDGDEGVKLYAAVKPDLVLLDITMPNKDGREALKEIMSANSAAKAIMVTAVKDGHVMEECLKSGAKAFVSKEHLYDNDAFRKEILATIEKVLKAA